MPTATMFLIAEKNTPCQPADIKFSIETLGSEKLIIEHHRNGAIECHFCLICKSINWMLFVWTSMQFVWNHSTQHFDHSNMDLKYFLLIFILKARLLLATTEHDRPKELTKLVKELIESERVSSTLWIEDCWTTNDELHLIKTISIPSQFFPVHGSIVEFTDRRKY